jgi:enamine deaminase RidA (YjgF/YER057c/UK114 family)
VQIESEVVKGSLVQRVALFNPESLAPPVGFAHAAAAAGWVWLGGQTSSDQNGKVVFPGDMAAQFRQAMTNVVVALRTAGCRPEGVVKITYFVTDVTMYRAALQPIGEAYREVFGRHFPAASLVEVKGLFDPEAMIEIECVAVQDQMPT